MGSLRTPVVDPLVDLARFGSATALVTADRVLSYADLDALVQDRCAELGSTRRLLLLECANELEPLITYLAALRGRHPVLLVPQLDGEAARRHHQRLIAAYDPDLCLTRGAAGGRPEIRPERRPEEWTLQVRREHSAHELHPDLAVLLGTSGSTGTPKLVRLSRENLVANATAIAGFLGLDGSSRAATTLPFQYCFGLSVVNSHLIAGGSLWLTGSSVVDPGFWEAFARAGATSFAGVPYTFDLLERSGPGWLATPGLRQILQAGGRMPPARVRAIAERASDRGASLFVMYGQTEATARMAYLPPHLAADRPECIGIPIEGGELRIEDDELVYSGPNVMLGYAESPADLALGRTVTELRTGDLAVQHDDGLFEITGRCNRLAKLFGVRLDLDHAERLLADHGIEARLVAGPERLSAYVLAPARTEAVVELLVAEHCLPAHAVAVREIEDVPRTTTGKVDYAALARLAVAQATEPATEPATGPADVGGAYAGVLGRPVAAGDTFVSLGGDSLSYVETYVRLERLLGAVPEDWPHRTVAELSALQVRRRRRWASLEMPVLLRAAAIVLIVGSHTELWDVMGGAHTLLALYGFAVARFALGAPTRRERLAALGRSLRELVLPAFLVVGSAALFLRAYDWPTVLLLNNWLGPRWWSPDWQLWFLESAAWSTVALAALIAVPWTGRLIARFPFAAPVAALAIALLVRDVVDHEPATTLARYSLERTVWLVALGWLIQAARTRSQRWLVTLIVPLSIHGFFPDNHPREWLIIGGVLALVWVRQVRVPRPLDRVLTQIASASLFIYLTHWHVYPHLEEDHQALAAVASLVVGIGVWRGYVDLRRRLRRTRGKDVHEPNNSGVPSQV